MRQVAVTNPDASDGSFWCWCATRCYNLWKRKEALHVYRMALCYGHQTAMDSGATGVPLSRTPAAQLFVSCDRVSHRGLLFA